MGATHSNAKQSKKPNKRSYGAFSQPPEARQDPKFPLEEFPVTKLRDAVVAVLAEGDAIMFSLTRDGGAVGITILSNNDRLREYATTVEELEELLDDIGIGP